MHYSCGLLRRGTALDSVREAAGRGADTDSP